MTVAPGVARPMTPADYQDGHPVKAAKDASPRLFDVVLGAVIAAAAFWIVPKVLDEALERSREYSDDWDDEETELEVSE